MPWAERRRLANEIGIVFGQRSQLWYHLRVRDSFDLLAKIYGLDAKLYRTRAERITHVLRIEALLDAPVKTLSLGQRMRCEIAAALLHGPKVLFLDEPTIGLDVTAKALLREHLKHLAEAEDTAIVLTSHDIGDIEQICARVILVNHGRILLDEPLENLRASFLREKRITIVTDDERPEPFGAAVVVERGPHRLTLSIDALGLRDRRGRRRGVQAAARARPHDRERAPRGDHSSPVRRAAMSVRRAPVRGALGALAHAFRLGWSETWEQRSALLGTFVNYAVILSLWANLYRQLHPQSLAHVSLGYAQVVWYLALTELVALAIGYAFRQIQDEILDGSVTALLVRPVGYVALTAAQELGRMTAKIAALAVPGAALAYWLTGKVRSARPSCPQSPCRSWRARRTCSRCKSWSGCRRPGSAQLGLSSSSHRSSCSCSAG